MTETITASDIEVSVAHATTNSATVINETTKTERSSERVVRSYPKTTNAEMEKNKQELMQHLSISDIYAEVAAKQLYALGIPEVTVASVEEKAFPITQYEAKYLEVHVIDANGQLYTVMMYPEGSIGGVFQGREEEGNLIYMPIA